MVLINQSTKEMTVKLVYYGPGLCGKTTNLEYIFQKSDPNRKGKLLSVATETDRTLFFDFLPMELGTVRGMKVRCQLYTVPGQVFYDATRRLVLRGADGVIFVADSQEQMLDANEESLDNLKDNLALNQLDPDSIPLVLQYNKRDLPNVLPVEEMDEALNWRGVPAFEASALSGEGVFETFKKCLELIIRNVSGSMSGKPAPPPLPESKTPAPAPAAAAPAPVPVQAPAAPAPPAPAPVAAEPVLETVPEAEPEVEPEVIQEVELEPEAAPEPEPVGADPFGAPAVNPFDDPAPAGGSTGDASGLPDDVRSFLLETRGTLLKQMRDIEELMASLEDQQKQINEILRLYSS